MGLKEATTSSAVHPVLTQIAAHLGGTLTEGRVRHGHALIYRGLDDRVKLQIHGQPIQSLGHISQGAATLLRAYQSFRYGAVVSESVHLTVRNALGHHADITSIGGACIDERGQNCGWAVAYGPTAVVHHRDHVAGEVTKALGPVMEKLGAARALADELHNEGHRSIARDLHRILDGRTQGGDGS